MKLRHNFPATLSDRVLWRPLEGLRPYPNNPRRHFREQIKAIASSLQEFGFVRPIAIDERATILLGHAVVEASRYLDLPEVPTLTLVGLSETRKKAMVIADNRLTEKSDWDPELLKLQFEELIKLDFAVELTGFSVGEVDRILIGEEAKALGAKEDDFLDLISNGPPVSQLGDLWILGSHRLVCGDARQAEPYSALLGSELAQMVVTDPPYNVKIRGHARGRGRHRQREFAMASGEMSSPGFMGFLEAVMTRAIQFSGRGTIHYWCIDWRHLPELHRAATPLYTEWKNLLVWRKSNAGQGSFYRSQHELIAVFKAGAGRHINNFGLGSEGRSRTNVLDYPGGATPDAARQEELAIHPTVKPTALIADLILDCSRPKGLVLDLFGGSGTTILAAEQTGRRSRVIEIDPLYVDLSIRRWQRATGAAAIHAKTGKAFNELVAGAARD
jgi:DNA modification methylase